MKFDVGSRFFSDTKQSLKTMQAVIRVTHGVNSAPTDPCPKFLLNSATVDELTCFWVSHIGPKASAANYEYSIQFEGKQYRKNGKKDYFFEGTRRCLPCDLSHEHVKRKKCALVLDNESIEDVTKTKGNNEDSKLYYFLNIYKV